jgi:hypothetical protein
MMSGSLKRTQQSVPEVHRDNAPDPSTGSGQALWDCATCVRHLRQAVFWLRAYTSSQTLSTPAHLQVGEAANR